jgi:hypothetical protein
MTITHAPTGAPVAVPVPEFQRLTYFYGQLLGPKDLQGEQTYLREKHRLANRFLHGFGVVCGLEVEPAPDAEDCVSDTQKEYKARYDELQGARQQVAEATEALGQLDEKDPGRAEAAQRRDQSQARLDELEAGYQSAGYGYEPPPVTGPCARVTPGVALDCRGDEVVLRDSVELDLWKALSREDQQRVESGHDRIWVSVCYCEQKVNPARPLYDDGCSLPADCTYIHIRETATVKVTVDRPRQPQRCQSCFGDCPDPCVALARITGFRPGQELEPGQIDNGARRMLARHQLTTISGISFVHGASYDRDVATRILQDGFEVRFSSKVRVDSLTDEVVDILVYEGGGGRAGNVYTKPGQYEPFPAGDFVDRFVYKQRSDERLEHGDRVLIQVKADFILDECCRAVDGNHIGGRVPLLPDYEQYATNRPASCDVSPDRPGAWVSGNGTQGGTFESWFLVEQGEAGSYERERRYR